MDKQRLRFPILCFDGEGLCGEIYEWREKAGLEPKQTSVQNFDPDDFDEMEFAVDALAEVMSDPFSETLNELVGRLEDLSLIESLPEVHLK